MKVWLGVPSNGTLSEGAAEASFLPSNEHEVVRVPSFQSGPNFNNVWTAILNAGLRGDCELAAIMHTDIRVEYGESQPEKRWLDILVEDMLQSEVEHVSAISAIKDHRGRVSCGVGDPADQWDAWRFLTARELANLPPVFSVGDLGEPDKYLLHNQALCVFDMRSPKWYMTDRNGKALLQFPFTEEIYFSGGVFNKRMVSEDLMFSRLMWQHGITSRISKRVVLNHAGIVEFPNHGDWGSFQNGDEDTAYKWRKPALAG